MPGVGSYQDSVYNIIHVILTMAHIFFSMHALHSSDGDLVTSVTPTCSANGAAVEVVARSDDDIRSEDSHHRGLLIRIDYLCIGEDGLQVSDSLQVATSVDSRGQAS